MIYFSVGSTDSTHIQEEAPPIEADMPGFWALLSYAEAALDVDSKLWFLSREERSAKQLAFPWFLVRCQVVCLALDTLYQIPATDVPGGILDSWIQKRCMNSWF